MEIKEKINKDFITAFKAKEMEKKNFLGTLRGEIEREYDNPNNDDIIKKINSLIKKNKESIAEYNVPTLTDSELEVLNSYLPKQMSEEEVVAEVEALIGGGASNIGDIMKGFSGKQVDRKLVSTIAKNKLNIN